MTTALSDFEREITPFIHGVPRPSVERAVLDAVQKFCNDTLLYSQELTAITVVADTANYTLSAPADTKFVRVMNVKYKTNGADNDEFYDLREMSDFEYQQYRHGPWKYHEAETPSKFWVTEAFVLYLYPIPTEGSTSGLLVEAALKPDDEPTTVPDFLLINWRKEIGRGALAHLFAQKAQSWYDPKSALEYEARFKRDIGTARWVRITGKTMLQPKIRIPFFA
jgi:predicted acetyltransferase